MKNLDDYRRERAAASVALTAAAAMIQTQEATGDAVLIAQSIADFDLAETAFNAAAAAVKREEVAEAARAASATSSDTTAPAVAATVPAVAVSDDQKGIMAGFMLHALTNAKGDKDKAMALLERDGHSAVSAALSGATDSAGGVTIPRAQAQEVIDLLRAKVAVRASGARSVPLPAGELRHARMTGGATASYGVENGAAVESEQTFDAVEQKFKTLTGLVPVGNALLRHSSAAIAMMVRDDLVKVMALREDLAFLRGDGTVNTPKGLKSWVLPANVFGSIGVTPAAVEAAIRGMVSRVEDANVGMVAPGWIMRASAKNFLASLRDPSSGALLFPSIDASGTLKGYGIKTTSQLPDNLGVGTNESEVFFADFDEVMIGDALSLTIATSAEASFVNGSGATISAFQNDLTLMRAIAEHDLAPAHDEALAMLNGAGWSL